MLELQTFYKVTVNNEHAMSIIDLDAYMDLDLENTLNPKTLAHMVEKEWRVHSRSNLDGLRIEPLPHFHIINTNNDAPSKQYFVLTITKKQERSKQWDYCLANLNAGTREVWQEPILEIAA